MSFIWCSWSRENRYKTVSTLYQTCVICIWSKFSTDHIQQIRNESKNYDNPEEPKQLRYAPIIIWINFFYSLLIDISDNVIDRSVLRAQNFHQWQCSIIVTWYRRWQRSLLESKNHLHSFYLYWCKKCRKYSCFTIWKLKISNCGFSLKVTFRLRHHKQWKKLSKFNIFVSFEMGVI